MISMHGPRSSYALGWRDRESQRVRFEALAGIAELNNHSIEDAGCGYGDLLPFLKHLYPSITYTGIEQIPELLNEAINRYGIEPGIDFVSGNFITMELPIADYILASGSLNYQSTDPQFIYNAISKLYNGCRMGLGFNLLKTAQPHGFIVAYNPIEIMEYCKSICPKVVLKDDYADEDYTIFMYK